MVGGGKARDFLAWFFPHNRIILIELDDDDGGEERDCDCQLWNVLILVARGLHKISYHIIWVGGPRSPHHDQDADEDYGLLFVGPHGNGFPWFLGSHRPPGFPRPPK